MPSRREAAHACHPKWCPLTEGCRDQQNDVDGFVHMRLDRVGDCKPERARRAEGAVQQWSVKPPRTSGEMARGHESNWEDDRKRTQRSPQKLEAVRVAEEAEGCVRERSGVEGTEGPATFRATTLGTAAQVVAACKTEHRLCAQRLAGQPFDRVTPPHLHRAGRETSGRDSSPAAPID